MSLFANKKAKIKKYKKEIKRIEAEIKEKEYELEYYSEHTAVDNEEFEASYDTVHKPWGTIKDIEYLFKNIKRAINKLNIPKDEPEEIEASIGLIWTLVSQNTNTENYGTLYYDLETNKIEQGYQEYNTQVQYDQQGLIYFEDNNLVQYADLPGVYDAFAAIMNNIISGNKRKADAIEVAKLALENRYNSNTPKIIKVVNKSSKYKLTKEQIKLAIYTYKVYVAKYLEVQGYDVSDVIIDCKDNTVNIYIGTEQTNGFKYYTDIYKFKADRIKYNAEFIPYEEGRDKREHIFKLKRNRDKIENKLNKLTK